MALREVLVQFDVETKDAEAAVDKLNSTIDNLTNAAVVVAKTLAVGAVAVGFNKLIDFASAAAERVNKFQAVFLDASSTTQRELEAISQRTGIAAGELQGFAAGIGAIIKPALGSSEAAGKMGASVAGLALDIASFNDVNPEDALVALRSALIGSAEPLQRFGVDTRVAAIEAEALRQGISKSFKSMSEGERIQLRYAAIIRQLGVQGAIGDAAKTSNQLANATRGLNSQFKRLAEIIGGFFVADAARTAVRLRELVDAVNQWIVANDAIIRQRINDVLQVINNTIDGIIIGVKFLAKVFITLGEVIGPVASSIIVAIGAIALLVAILGAPIVAVLALGAAISLMIDDLVVWARGGESLFGVLIEGIKTFFDEFRESSPLFNDFVETLSGVWDEVLAVWVPAIDGFFSLSFDKMVAFVRDGIPVVKKLFEDIAETVGSALKTIFGGTIGRVIIDFLGAKAGSVVGEFIARLVGRLAGKIAGKGIIGKAISSRIGEELFALVGKGAGGIIGALKADELALGVQALINAPTTVAPAAGGLGGMMVSQTTSLDISVDASGNAQPTAVGTAVAEQVSAAMDDQMRRAMRGATVAGRR